MPTVSAHVAHALVRPHRPRLRRHGQRQRLVPRRPRTPTDARFTAVRHEAGGVVAADAHFRASGRIAAATATYGAGFTNTLTALAEAAQARVPLVLVVGDEPTSGPRPWDVDQIALASAVGARTYTVGRTDAAATTISRSSTRWPTGCRPCSRSPTTSPPSSGRDARGAGASRSGAARAGRTVRAAPSPTVAARSRTRAGRCCSPGAAPGSPTRARRSANSPSHRRRSPPRPRSGAACSPTSLRPRRRRAGSAPRARWSSCARPTSPSCSAPRSTSSRCASASCSRRAPGCSRSTSRAAATHPNVGGSSVATQRRRPSDRRRARRARRSSLRLARDGRRRGRLRATSPATVSPPTAGSTRAPSPRASASCCPRTASSSPTAATSSAGRTCTGPSPRPTA